jgi:hypothetical protein
MSQVLARMRPTGRADQCPQLGVERTQRGRRGRAVHGPTAVISRVEIPQCSRSPTRPASAQERALHLEPQNAARLLGLTLLTRAAMAGVPEAQRFSLSAADGFPRGGMVSHRIHRHQGPGRSAPPPRNQRRFFLRGPETETRSTTSAFSAARHISCRLPGAQ